MKKSKKLSINPVFTSNQTRLAVLITLLSNPRSSYSAIGALTGISKQRVHVIVKGLKEQLPWLDDFIDHSQQKRCKCGKHIPNNYQICPDCKKEKQRAWRREYMRHYYQDEQNHRKHIIRLRTYTEQSKGNIIKADHCALCGSKDNLVLHHNSFNDESFIQFNVMTLCKSCNNKLSGVMKHV